MKRKRDEYQAVIMLNKKISNMIAERWFKSKGYYCTIIDPLPESLSTQDCIKALNHEMEGFDLDRVVIFALEANYSFSGQPICNEALLDYVCDHINPFYLFTYSATPEALSAAELWMAKKQTEAETKKSKRSIPRLMSVDFNKTDHSKIEGEVPNISRQPTTNKQGSPDFRRTSIY